MRKVCLFILTLILVTNLSNFCIAQSVLDPNDPIVEYDSLNPPQPPPWEQIGKWVRTKTVYWNTDSYKAYFYKGFPFRLKYPKTYDPTANDGKKYPMIIVFHGLGEKGYVYDNETQLYHGSRNIDSAVDESIYDGYAFFMQTPGFFGITQFTYIAEIIDYMITNNKLDPFRISNYGLSAGGQAAWEMLLNFPAYISSSLPMSSVSIGYRDDDVINKVKFTPMWNFHGALDGSPSPYTAAQVRDAMVNAGANYKDTEYPDLGHGVWDRAQGEPDFFPFIIRSYKSNPWALYGRTDFCSGDNINLTVGLVAGFNEYQWRKDGVIIANATSNTINVTQVGTYDARVRRGSNWSQWSPVPVVVKYKGPTISPAISVAGLMSTAIPSADDRNYVNLQVPDSNYTSYTWKKVGNDSILGTSRIFSASQPGDYTATVTEQYGCSTIPSPPFKVINANGTNAPDPAANLTALAISNTQVELDWANRLNSDYNETAFEIYRSTTAGGPYSFVGQTPADTVTFKDNALQPNVKYFYRIRAINDNGAAPLSNEASATTQSDKIPPTAPSGLEITSVSNTYLAIKWQRSTDDVGIAKYEIYVNGIKTYSTVDTSFVVGGLQEAQQYAIYVRAVDKSGNNSPRSRQLSATALLVGLSYKYYEGLWFVLPDFATLSPVEQGITPNISIGVANRAVQWGILWEGFIRIPITGTYTFQTTSNDGSKLWLEPYKASDPPLVNNDGDRHVLRTKSGTINLQAGAYPISIAFFQRRGERQMTLTWKCQELYGDTLSHPVTDEFFSSDANIDTIARPTNTIATALSYDKIKVLWTDNSTTETNFEIYRSTSVNDKSFNIIATVDANTTSFIDSNLAANTKYFYKAKAINEYTSSEFDINKPYATTLKLPAKPKRPGSPSAIALSPSSIQLTWTDADTLETGFQVYRSIGDANNFKLFTRLAANNINYTDTGLFANLSYYYKLAAINAGGASVFSNTVSAKTKDNPPVIIPVPDKAVRYGITSTIEITAKDTDEEVLSFSIINNPSFGTFIDNGNRTATLILNPSSANQGVYQNLQVVVQDMNGGSDTTVFNLTVNDNYEPAIDTIINYVINENDNLNIGVSAHDLNPTDTLYWAVSNLPDSFSLTTVTNGEANLFIHPKYSAAGVYTVSINVNDGKGGSAVRQFSLTVNNKEPNIKIYTRFKDQAVIGTPWNSISGVTTNNLKDANGNVTNIGLALQTSWWAVWHEGPQTGNNSGVYPDAVLKDYYYFGINGGPQTVTSNITGLDTAGRYDITFYSGSIWSGASDNGTTTYTIGSQTLSLYVQNNTQNTVTFGSVKPAAGGIISFTMAKGSNTPSGYINAIVITSLYDDGTIPVPVKTLTAKPVAGKGIQLSWQDVAYNETGYYVYRSLSPNGTYDLIGTITVQNAQSYTDSAVTGNEHYYYKIKAYNFYGLSEYSNLADAIAPIKILKINPIANVTLRTDQQSIVPVTATAEDLAAIKLTASQLPAFITFTDGGNGTGVFNIQPTPGCAGIFPGITVTAANNIDSSRSASFDIIVIDKDVSSVYINFSDGSIAPKPWNNFTGFPSAGKSLSNLQDDSAKITGLSLILVNGFQGVRADGMRPGNGRSVFPEMVMRTGEFEGTTTTRTIKISGLSVLNKYNFLFFNSHDNEGNGLTNFTINGQTVSLKANYNIDKTAQINGIAPDANGEVLISVAKGSGADFAYLNALIIQSYTNSLTLLSPIDLRVINTKRNSVTLQWVDRSYNETCFEIWRGTDTGQYALIDTVAANSTSYTNSNLSSNKTYYYLVRAKQNNVFSNYSNIAGTTTYAYQVYINFTNTNPAPPPWNNTNSLPQQGYVWHNFIDEAGTFSSIGMIESGLFDGLYEAGVNTGNNSGIFPDKVMMDSYGLFPGNSATITVTGLSLTMNYDLTFFASSLATGDVNVSYRVNNKTCLLNASLNRSGTVTMYGIAPDSNGTAVITIAPGTAASQFGLIGALIVQGYTSSNASIPPPPSFNKIEAIAVQTQTFTEESIDRTEVVAYPNPFNNYFVLSVPSLKQYEKIRILIYNVNGKLVYGKQSDLNYGNNTITINPKTNSFFSGMYLVKILYLDEKKFKVIKLIKQ